MIRLLRNKRANAFVEYGVIIGIVAVVLVGMNLYVKRGMQGRIKDMSDYFIAPESEHLEQMNEDVNTTQSSQTSVGINQQVETLTGGETDTIFSQGLRVQSSSASIDTGETEELNPPSP